MTVPVIEAVSTANSSGTVTKPTGTTSGELLVAFYGHDSVGRIDTIPSGFKLVGGWLGDGGTTLSIWAKTAGGSEPASYTWDNENVEEDHITMFRISGAGGIVPMVRGRGSDADTTTITWRSVTTDTADCLILAGCQVDDANELGAAAAPTDWTEQSSLEASTTNQWTMSRSLATAGAVPSASITVDAAEEWAAGMIAIWDSSGGTPGDPADHVVTEYMVGNNETLSSFTAYIPDYFATADDIAAHIHATGDEGGPTLTEPTGWTEDAVHQDAGDNCYAAVMHATLDGTETVSSETYSVSVSLSDGTQTTMLLRRVTFGGISANNSGNSQSIDCLTVTTEADDLVMLIGAAQSDNLRMNFGFPSGYDGPQGGGSLALSRAQVAVGYGIDTSGGATGTQSITTAAVNEEWVGWTLFFEPSLTLTQEGWRAYEDDADPSGAPTALAAQDTAVTGREVGQGTQLRVIVDANNGDPAAEAFKLQHNYSGDEASLYEDTPTS